MASSNTREKIIRLFIYGLCLLIPAAAFSSNVRELNVSNESMAPIFLKMGKSTVLRFREKPQKVIVGNQNYYGLEFVENDVAIQPLGAVATNLFVYTENHTYGFLLTPGERYDDLVFVRWKVPRIKVPQKTVPNGKVTNLKSIISLGENLRIELKKIQGPSTFGLYIIDCSIKNLGKREQDISNLELQAIQNRQPLEKQSLVLEQEILKPHENVRARIIMKVSKKSDFIVEGKLGSRTGKAVIRGSLL